MTIKVKHSLLAASVAVALASPMTVLATNGMNLEGYGPIATGMGGASMAYDNGVAAVMNNPATLGLMKDGESRLDVAVGNLGPDIDNDAGGFGTAKSGGDSYFMPAIGYAKRSGQLTYGVGMSAQGGMGTEYAGNTFMGAGTGLATRSEVGVGRIVAPIVYNVDKNLTIGGSIDYVWATMDLQMAASATQVNNMIQPGTTLSLPGAGWTAAYIDFSDDNDFSGKAGGAGFAGKIGLTYKVSNEISIGATYHTETNMGDLETSGSGAGLSLYNGATPFGPTTFGKMAVNDFQWPSSLGVGMAYKQDKFMIAADVKTINWSDVMSSFNMTFSAGGAVAIMAMPQNWEDQTVIQIGGSYKLTSATTLRAGVNSASNPIPNSTVNPLFPATVENHYTFGVGHNLSKMSAVNFSLAIAPEVSVTSSNAPNTVTTHAQTNWQVMYTQKF